MIEQLNLTGGSYLHVGGDIREQVNREFEAFIVEQIRHRQSFAFRDYVAR